MKMLKSQSQNVVTPVIMIVDDTDVYGGIRGGIDSVGIVVVL